MGRIGEEGEEEDGAGSELGEGEEGRELEERLEELAEEMAVVIGRSPPSEREALHDYAVSLVRERLPVAAELSGGSPSPLAETEASPELGAGTRGGVQSLGYGLLVLPVGFLLLWIFPPIGMMLMGLGAAMVVWGLVAAVLARLTLKSAVEPPAE